MICVIDANVLVLWANIHTDERTLLRLENLLDSVGKAGGRVVLPTPAISELLVRAEAGGAAWLSALQRRSSVLIAPFDVRAAAECAMIHRSAIQKAGKRYGTKPGEAYQKIKVDRQIAAIALVHGADLVVTADENLMTVCAHVGISSKRVEELELPTSAAQMKIDYQAAEQASADLPAAAREADAATSHRPVA